MVITGVTIENYVRGEKERGEGMGHPRVSTRRFQIGERTALTNPLGGSPIFRA